MKKNILVTGASSGFGLLIANELHKNGYNVIGTSRNPEKYIGKIPFQMIALDLDSEQSINSFSERIFKKIGQLDILINNAGFLVSGIAEETPVELGRQQLETNFWGTIKVTNAILPHFRKQKFGKIITVGSIIGLVSFPNAAYYAASKHALEGYFKSLRYELNEFNISVAMIEPAAFKTSILDNSTTTLNKIEDYNTLRNKIEKFTENLVDQAEDPAMVAEKVLKVVQTDKPKFRNIVGKGTSALINLQHFAYGVLEKNVLKQLNKA
ncbi:SDR family oxidoreductase [Flavobacterium chungangense]|uniref:Short-chain dehydrogenase/reductase n=1 Tax=Flavobacterium chungangense TaxID=554283 RepID=A0A6V6Z1N6_9FLAO|nr:SDR family oxidoreductase [Flavobacterium chungangense]CAD0005489.1 short-chain dehydrogenase/reductase [Flavobacterium chungangense]